MARGWESKAVESQQEDRRRSTAGRPGPHDPHAGERERLRLSRAALAGELDRTRAAPRRQALGAALAQIDEALAALDSQPDDVAPPIRA
jgi:hypothetical protein